MLAVAIFLRLQLRRQRTQLAFLSSDLIFLSQVAGLFPAGDNFEVITTVKTEPVEVEYEKITKEMARLYQRLVSQSETIERSTSLIRKALRYFQHIEDIGSLAPGMEMKRLKSQNMSIGEYLLHVQDLTAVL